MAKSNGVKFRTLIPRCVALGASPASFLRGGANCRAASSHVDLGPEDVEQAVFMAVCRSHGLNAWANMNGSHLSRASRAKATVLGRSKGVPDVMVTALRQDFPSEPGPACIAIEFKRPDLRPKRSSTDPMGKAEPEQREWLKRLHAAGWTARVCFTADDAVALLRAEGVL